jgi:hypothetical protein
LSQKKKFIYSFYAIWFSLYFCHHSLLTCLIIIHSSINKCQKDSWDGFFFFFFFFFLPLFTFVPCTNQWTFFFLICSFLWRMTSISLTLFLLSLRPYDHFASWLILVGIVVKPHKVCNLVPFWLTSLFLPSYQMLYPFK